MIRTMIAAYFIVMAICLEPVTAGANTLKAPMQFVTATATSTNPLTNFLSSVPTIQDSTAIVSGVAISAEFTVTYLPLPDSNSSATSQIGLTAGPLTVSASDLCGGATLDPVTCTVDLNSPTDKNTSDLKVFQLPYETIPTSLVLSLVTNASETVTAVPVYDNLIFYYQDFVAKPLPEPSAVWLFGAGLFALLMITGRRAYRRRG